MHIFIFVHVLLIISCTFVFVSCYTYFVVVVVVIIIIIVLFFNYSLSNCGFCLFFIALLFRQHFMCFILAAKAARVLNCYLLLLLRHIQILCSDYDVVYILNSNYNEHKQSDFLIFSETTIFYSFELIRTTMKFHFNPK